VERKTVDADLSKDGQPLARVRHHEVAVEESLRVLAQAGDSGDAERDVRHKMAVHDVDVEGVSA